MAKKRAKKQEWFNFERAVFLLLLLVLFVLLKTAFTPPETVELSEESKIVLVEEAESVLNTLTNGKTKVSLVGSNGLVEERVMELEQRDYNEIKSLLGIKNDFCLFFEDVTGNLVKVNDMEAGIGSGRIYINGEPCK